MHRSEYHTIFVRVFGDTRMVKVHVGLPLNRVSFCADKSLNMGHVLIVFASKWPIFGIRSLKNGYPFLANVPLKVGMGFAASAAYPGPNKSEYIRPTHPHT